MIITLGKSQFSFIQCYKAQFDLKIGNKLAVRCADCSSRILPGEAINRRQYRHNGYLCFSCFSSHLKVATFRFGGGGGNDAGFVKNYFDQLQSCSLASPTFTTPQIIESVLAVLLKNNPGFTQPVQIQDQPKTPAKARAALVARMTLRKPGKPIVTIEIRSDAGYHNFYTWFKGQGRGRKQVNISARSLCQKSHPRYPVGLEVIAEKRREKGETVKITILKKKLYRKFISCSADQLPGYKPVIVNPILEPIPAWQRRGARITAPAELFTRIQNSEITS